MSLIDEIVCCTPSWGAPVRELVPPDRPLDDVETGEIIDLTAAELRVLSVVMRRQWMTTATIARAAGVTQRVAAEHLGELETRGNVQRRQATQRKYRSGQLPHEWLRVR